MEKLLDVENILSGKLESVKDRVRLPSYLRERRRYPTRHVHFGPGAFGRAHSLDMVDSLLGANKGHAYTATVVSFQTRDTVKKLNEQDGLYTLVKRNNGGVYREVVGSVANALYAPDDPASVLSALGQSQVLTLTITRDGYGFNQAASENASSSEGETLDNPRSAVGFIASAMYRRYQEGREPFVVVSCDNVPRNGCVARDAVLDFSSRQDANFASWLLEHGMFLDSLPDRIVPNHAEKVRSELAEFGLIDRLALMTEPQRIFWVENNHRALRYIGHWADADVRFCPKREIDELLATKLLVLNASHAIVALVGSLLGYPGIHVVAGMHAVQRLLLGRASEIAPTIASSAGTTLYLEQVIERFTNAALDDEVVRVGRNMSQKIRDYVIHPIVNCLAAHDRMECSAQIVALWVHFLMDTKIRLPDRKGEELQKREFAKQILEASESGSVNPLLEVMRKFPEIFPRELWDSSFPLALWIALGQIAERGVYGAIEKSVASPSPDFCNEYDGYRV